MTGQRKVEASAHAVSVNRRIHRGRELRDRIHQILSHRRKIKGGASSNPLDFPEIGSGREKLRISCENERFGIAPHCPHGLVKFAHTCASQTVRLVFRRQSNFKVSTEIVDDQVIGRVRARVCDQLDATCCACEKKRSTRL